ncbi:MAG TPA: hypothetical protein VMC07_00845 [Candidatus Omnitrophota bacterium]|nr:hypothetical protein [Candidatus Omnitrophota bacterium]
MISLDTLAHNGTMILFDTSGLLGYLPDGKKLPVPQKEKSLMNAIFLKQMMHFLPEAENHIYITDSVERELAIKMSEKQRKAKSIGEREEAANIRRLLQIFFENDRVMNGEYCEEAFSRLSEKYSGMRRVYDLSQTDFDILMRANAIGYTKEQITLVTNDLRGIAKAGGVLMNCEPYLQNYVYYLKRNGPFSFDVLNGFSSKIQATAQ